MIRLTLPMLMVAIVVAAQAPTQETTIKTSHFTLRVPLTEAGIERGLMGVRDIPSGTGMVFDLGPGQEAWFWMRNCLTSMDMVFLDENGKVQGIVAAFPPPTSGDGPFYTANGPRYSRWWGPSVPKTRYVVEVRLGEGQAFAKTDAAEIPSRHPGRKDL